MKGKQFKMDLEFNPLTVGSSTVSQSIIACHKSLLCKHMRNAIRGKIVALAYLITGLHFQGLLFYFMVQLLLLPAPILFLYCLFKPFRSMINTYPDAFPTGFVPYCWN